MLVWVGANTSWLWVTQISTSYRCPCLLVWFWTRHLVSLITCFFTSRVEMTILLHHRAVWKIAWDKTCIGTYMRVAQFSSVMQSCPTLCDPVDTRPSCPSPTPRAYSNSCPSSRWCHPTNPHPLIPCHPLLLLLSIFPSIRVFSSESALHIRWPTYWSFSISLSSEYSGLISGRLWQT